jgi:hypothetical protein
MTNIFSLDDLMMDDFDYIDDISLEQTTQASETSSNVSHITGQSDVTDTHIVKKPRINSIKRPGGSVKRSFVWKHFEEKNDPNGTGKIMTCEIPCTAKYAAFGSTSNAIQHLASVHGILDKDKLHVKVI